MASMRKLTIQYSLVPIPVAMSKATNERKRISLSRLHKTCNGPSGTKMYCKSCKGEPEIKMDDVVSGYEFAKGQYVLISEAEKESVKIDSTNTVLVQEVVPFNTIPVGYLSGDIYFLEPQDSKTPPTAFALFRNTLKDRAAIGRVSMYDREYTVAITAGQNGLVMYYLRYPEELRDEPSLSIPATDPNQQKMMDNITKSLLADEPMLDFEDQYTERFQAVINSKITGVAAPEVQAVPPPAVVPGLDELLKASQSAPVKKAPKAKPKAVKVPTTKKKGKAA